ncbi:AMP-binding protein [Streptomyces sp. NPDC006476]|uniref:AMP-binding protein n=1 Tax=Streptomyces sp. NPDC006476 TaxID=3157175 RepID=UPI00339E4DAC
MELASVLGDCNAAVVFTSSEQGADVLALTRSLPDLGMVVAFDDPPQGAVGFAELLASDTSFPAFAPDPAAASAIGYTSGTTGRPKGRSRAIGQSC